MTADDKPAVKTPAGAGAAVPLSDLKRLGKYQIEKKIGAGGMGAVFLARDTELKRTVALKVLPKDKAENPILVRRFRAEAQAAAQLRHPNIVAVFDSGEADGYLYIAMEFVDGVDLFELVSKRGVVPIRRSIDIIKQVAAALQHAFEQNIVHRDIKPSNLLIRKDGTVKLTDLGLARSIDDTLETNITRAGTTVGTVDYMSPEQARNSKLADIRSDLYSLGCTWYQMLTGSPPYPDGSVTNKLQAHAIKPIPDPREMNPQVSEGLTAVLRRMMAKKPEDRYQTPADLIEELNHAKLTQASISREIFSDLSDSELNVELINTEEEGYSDDGYFGFEEDSQPKPTERQSAAPAGKSFRRPLKPRPEASQDEEEPEDEQPSSYYKPKSRPKKIEEAKQSSRRQSRVEADEDVEDAGDDDRDANRPRRQKSADQSDIGDREPNRRRTQPATDDEQDETEESAAIYHRPKSAPKAGAESSGPRSIGRPKTRTSADEEPAEETQDISLRPKAKTRHTSNNPEVDEERGRPGKGKNIEEIEDADEAEQSRGKVKSRGSKSDAPDSNKTAKGSETESGKQKTSGPKALPPKRQPLPEESASAKSAISPDLIRYLAALAGLVLLIVGIGWLISGYGAGQIEKNPLAAPPETVLSPPPVIPNAGKGKNDGQEVPAVAVVSSNPLKIDSAGPTFDVEKVPDWATKELDTAGLKVLTVGPGEKNDTNFSTLEEALLATTPAGAVIRLQGPGPFPLPSIEIAQRRRLVISNGSPQERPVITLKPSEGQTTAGLKLIEGTLDLRNLHFSIDPQVFSGPVKVIDVVDGQFAAQQCSFTLTSPHNDSVTAISIGSSIDSTSVPRMEPTVLLDRVFVRGEGLQGLSIRRANVDALVRECLMATGTSAAIEVAGHIAPGVAELTTSRPRRVLRVQKSTLFAQQRIFDLSVDDSGKPPQTSIALKEVLCAAQQRADHQNSTIIFAGHWPQLRSTSEGWLTRMTWTSTNTVYLGFDELIDLGASFKVVDSTAWQRVWGVRADSRQFQKIRFPESVDEELSVALPQEFDSARLAYREVQGADGSLPGCPVSRISVPDANSQLRLAAMSQRPSIPLAATKPGNPPQIRKVDLKKEDLGVILNKGDWQNGTQFELSGSGICPMTPARIEGKSLRIVFKQSEGPGIRLQFATPKAAEASKASAPALISILRGSLEVTNGTLEGNTNAKSPEWLVQGIDATLILSGCRLISPDGEGSRNGGLVRWVCNQKDQGSPDSPVFLLRDSFLAGTGCGIRSEGEKGALILRNSIIVLRGDAIDLRPSRSGNSLAGACDAENVTISATGACVRFEAAAGTEPVSSPYRIFMEKCAFAPPLAFKTDSSQATLLQCVGPVFEQAQLEWWGTSNGAARQVLHLIRRDGDSGPPSDERTGLTAWKKMWDKSNSVRMLTGDKGVYLSGEVPGRWKDVKPGAFELHKNSLADTWAEGGKPIGANPQAIEEFGVSKKSIPDVSKPAVAPTIPANKKNIGF